MRWSDWLVILLYVLIPIFAIVSKHWVRAKVEESVRYKFNSQIEELRSELRKNEQSFSSELRAKESEFAALRDAVLSGRLHRQSLLDKRRIEAVERAWSAVMGAGDLKRAALMMDLVKMKPEYMSVIKKFHEESEPLTKQNLTILAITERPFLSPMAWALLSAHHSILSVSQIELRTVLLSDVGKIQDFVNLDGLRQILIRALPNHASMINAADGNYLAFLHMVEEELFVELTKSLGGKEVDKAEADNARDLLASIARFDAKNAGLIATAEVVTHKSPG